MLFSEIETDYQKIEKIILSCKTVKQIESLKKIHKRFIKKHIDRYYEDLFFYAEMIVDTYFKKRRLLEANAKEQFNYKYC